MKQKIQKIIILSTVMIISVTFLRCQKEEDLVSPEINNVSRAKEWFKKYESTTDNYPLFQNLKYDWANAEFKKNKDGTQLVIVPINELKKNKDENWEQKLYIYELSENNYKALLHEFYPERSLNDDADLLKFSGYISVWDLKFGFIKAAEFVDDKMISSGVVEIILSKKINPSNITGKAPMDPDDNTYFSAQNQDGTHINLRPVYVTSNASKYYDIIYNPRGSDITGGNSSDYTSGYAGGGGTGGSASGNPIMPPPPKLPISDIKKFLSCLNTAASANLTVYAEKTDLSNLNVGHAFISISQGNNIMTYGFYPENGYDKSFIGPGIMGNNGGDFYNVSGNIGQITPKQLQQIISLSVKYQNSWYDIDTNNCSDFAADVLNIVGVASNNSFETPSTVANTLQKVPNHTSIPNYAPKTKRTCP
ncbi:hypothetical protein LPB248_07550 [Flavobacterium sp. LPB0248]|uniref:hypothetical protein n=1 Tax=Flavobacterium sp. LPB0248 TaxID=2614441 RepID=UPI0015A5B0BD|nr:hypothetical protein [Flavobacterium sp. LPB0248]QLC66138.1 hypothetical protein LPB248_07550 [Flavobacterium sp. LPB0248]